MDLGCIRVILRSESETIEFGRDSCECATLRALTAGHGAITLVNISLTALLTEELAVAGGDPVFDRAMRRVKELAEAN